MVDLVPVDHDPFAVAGGNLVPVDHDPFGGPGAIATDVAKGVGSGIVHDGVNSIVGMPGDVSRFADWGPAYGIAKLAELTGMLPKGKTAADLYKSAQALDLPSQTALPTTTDLQGNMDKVAPGLNYTPQTEPGKLAKAAAGTVPAALLGGGGLLGNLATGARVGIGSELAGQAVEGTPYQDFAPYARVAGGLMGAAAPAAAGRLITPLPATPVRQQAVGLLANEGVPLTAGQQTGSKPLQIMESTLSEMPGAGGAAHHIDQAQREAFTSAAMRRAGGEGLATSDNLQATRGALSNRFTDLSNRNTLQMDAPFANDLGQAVQDYVANVAPSQRAPGIGRMVDDFINIANGGGQIAGPAYQAMRSRLTNQANSLRQADPQQAGALRGMRNALDDAMERSIQTNNPADAGAWAEARRQYGNLKAIEKAAGAAGENAASGFISPQQLRTAIASGNNRGAYARGQGDLADLTRAGNVAMTPFPNSGTAARTHAQHLTQMAGGIGGAMFGGAEGAAAGLAAATAGPAVAGRLLMSPLVQQYLANQAIPRGLLNADPAATRLGLLSTAARLPGF